MRLSASFCTLAVACGLFFAAPPACSPQSPPAPLIQLDWEPDDDAELSYGILLLEQGLRDDDIGQVLEASALLAKVSPSSRPFVEAAAWLLLNRSPALAREVLAPALLRFPDDINPHLLMGEAWLEDNEPDKAVQVVRSYQIAHPESIQAKNELGVLFAKADRNAEAVAVFERVPEQALTPFVRYCYAKALNGVQRADEAVAQLREAVREIPDFMEAWNDLAQILEEQNDYRQAAGIYEHVLEHDPTNSMAWVRLIGVYLDAGDMQSAVEVAKNFGDSMGGAFSAVSLFLDRKLHAEARTLLDFMLAKPDVPEEIYFYLAATVYEESQDIDQALQWLERITAGNRLYPRALHLKTQLFLERKQHEDALKALTDAQDIMPDEPALVLMQAHVYNLMQRYTQSLSLLDEGLLRWPDNPDLVYSKGMALDLADRKTEAMDLMEGLARDLPHYYQALNYIGYSLAEQKKDLPRALDLLVKADQLSPNTAYILDSLAWAQFQSGQNNEAWNTICRAVDLEEGQDPVIWEHYGDIAKALGKLQEARDAYRKAIEIGHEKPDEIREKMRQL